jgi:hypothetical protein
VTRSALQIPLTMAYHRRALLAIELLDAVTLERVSQGIKVEAHGLRGKPILNGSGLFVWLNEDFAQLQKVSVEPGLRPYQREERAASQVQRPQTTIELLPRLDYPFSAGVTGLRGTLIERRVVPPPNPEPVVEARIRLRWLDEDGQWHDGAVASRTNERGDFVSFLRLAPNEKPAVDPNNGLVTVRLRVSREGLSDRTSADFQLTPERIRNPTPSNELTFAWNELTL